MGSHLREKMTQYFFHFGKVIWLLYGEWNVVGGAGVEAGRPVKRFSVHVRDDRGLDYVVVLVMEQS